MLSEICIVILNWNGKSFLEKFLPNVIANSGEAQIVVADNASTDDSVEFLKQHFPAISIVQNTSNGGFAKGYNDALKQVDSKYYLLLNSDIEVTPDWLLPLYDTITKDSSVVGCQPKILSQTKKHLFEHAGASGGFLDRNFYPFCRGRIFEVIEEDKGQYDYAQEIFWASGACLLIRSAAFHEHGGFDDDFFAHMEEIDLCWRIKRKGGRFMVNPASVVYHVGGGTLDYMSPKKTFLNFRNSLLMITKNYDGLLPLKLFYRLCLDGIAGLSFLFNGNVKHTLAVLEAHFDFYKKLPKFLIKRKKLKATPDKFNSAGWYQGSILWAKYVKKINNYKDLNLRLFTKANTD